jgi:hypothetical protein
VETPGDPDGEENGDASTDADQVHNEKDHKDQHLHFMEFREGVKVEEDHPSLICFLHVQCIGPSNGTGAAPEDR